MIRRRFGFTMVEVALFLAITAAIFIGVIAGTQNTVWHQKFNDSVQDFAEFMRSVYSQVSNPQSIGTGQSEMAIYGKLVVFGESAGLGDQSLAGETMAYVYDVVGNVKGTGSGDAITMLRELDANVVVGIYDGDRMTSVAPAGIVQSYLPRWTSTIEAVNPGEDGYLQPYKGSILVVRHPNSGTINTLVSSEVIEVNRTVNNANASLRAGGTANIGSLLKSKLNGFKTQDVDFCINPEGVNRYNGNRANLMRRDIRLVKNTRNASGVEVIDLDLNKVENGVQIGNRCRY